MATWEVGRQFGPGFVYLFLRANGKRKIGLSVNPAVRARAIGGALVVEHVIRTRNMRWLEQYLHDAFRHCQVGTGEWYALSEDEAALLRGVERADCESDLPHEVQSLNAAPGYNPVSVKMDEAVHPIARAAAALAGISTQELISNAVNEVASRLLKRDPVKRLPPRPKEKRKPRE